MCHVLKQIHLITCVKKRACAFACKEKNNQIGMKTASIFSPGTDLVPYICTECCCQRAWHRGCDTGGTRSRAEI